MNLKSEIQSKGINRVIPISIQIHVRTHLELDSEEYIELSYGGGKKSSLKLSSEGDGRSTITAMSYLVRLGCYILLIQKQYFSFPELFFFSPMEQNFDLNFFFYRINKFY